MSLALASLAYSTDINLPPDANEPTFTDAVGLAVVYANLSGGLIDQSFTEPTFTDLLIKFVE